MTQSTVLVVHGVSNRDPGAFKREVQKLGDAVDQPDLKWVAVYWGDLAPAATDLVCVPTKNDRVDLPNLTQEGIVQSVEDILPDSFAAPREPTDHVVERASQLIQESAGELPSPDVLAALVTAVNSAASPQQTVRPEVASVLADIVVSWPPSGTGSSEEALLNPLTSVLAHVAHRVDEEVGKAVGNAVQTILRGAESSVDRLAAKTVGDVLAYEAEGARIRGRLDAAYATTAGERVHILGHSLGSLAAAEWLLGADVVCDSGVPTALADRRIDTLVTFGSQVSLFAELHGLRTATGRQMPQALPVAFAGKIQQWINIWHQFDPLSFVMRHVILPQAKPVQDLRVVLNHIPHDLAELATAHSSYWTDPRFAAELARVLR